MADDGSTGTGSATAAEDTALQEALAAAHAAIWGYGVVGAALPVDARPPVVAAEQAHQDLRDQLTALLTSRGADPVDDEGGYALPFPVLSAVDAAALGATLEDGTAATWVRVLDRAAERTSRELAVEALAAAEVRAVGWRAAAGENPTKRALPGL